MGEHAHPTGTAWIWKIFWLLLAITAVEVALGIVKPEFLMVQFAGTSLLNVIFIGLTLVKAAYIVMYFMHLKFEETFLQWTIYLPVLILIPYLLFILIAEGAQIYAA
ncbi:MAG: cytochrome C oxidase subunit IV family protein [Schleiferiaceae bacterium]|jgi:caa(3)-type oxidase subunit IV|nr:cytochrome C oxidase subunit IV family protein [Schleiferiaceae bacterium]MDP4626842.1 cytochrome C oxidase subunit IV family protein [Schleiferiaceae bacterium]MDP4728970.1 cytochrome C oxidase subunit IV family protein [Schleiferiaceae bacterium]MDP4749093.1 cytochrome C oxidase subunit IV family protein [Schleiferiaceae bacterium]MDP4859615.1 cytochrome C oxidase subunit IV family protein [Schleiferiaceae bacterium]